MDGALRHALCDIVSALAEAEHAAGATVFLAAASDRSAIASALEALALLDPGQSAGDGASWRLALAGAGAPVANSPPWWPRGKEGTVLSRYLDPDGGGRCVCVHALGP